MKFLSLHGNHNGPLAEHINNAIEKGDPVRAAIRQRQVKNKRKVAEGGR